MASADLRLAGPAAAATLHSDFDRTLLLLLLAAAGCGWLRLLRLWLLLRLGDRLPGADIDEGVGIVMVRMRPQTSALRCGGAMQCGVMQCSAVRCNAVRCGPKLLTTYLEEIDGVESSSTPRM